MTQRAVQDAPEPSKMHLRTPPKKRRGFLLFIGLVLLLMAGLVATVLLANDGRNWHHLLQYFKGNRPDTGSSTQNSVRPPEPAPSELRGKRVASETSVLLPPHMFALPRLMDMSALVRSIPMSGKTVCEKLNAAGLANGGWAQNPYEARSYDCSVEVALPTSDPNADAPSFYLIVRGDETGKITQIRWKIIDIKNSAKLWSMYLQSITTLETVSGWNDFQPQFENMRTLTPFDVNHFGIGFKFSQESTGTARYNIILMPENEGELQRITRAVLNARSTRRPAPIVNLLWPRQRIQ